MRIMGGKFRLADKIADVVLQNMNKHKYYVEPFAGDANILLKIAEKSNQKLVTEKIFTYCRIK